MKILCVIPARYGSSRFPGKPLELISGKPMIEIVYNNCLRAFGESNTIVATDDKRIHNLIEKIGGKSIIINNECNTGTDRIYEVSKIIESDLYINVQGDEPLISTNDLIKFKNFVLKNHKYVCNAFSKISNEKEFKSMDTIKMIVGKNNELLYSSRLPVPYNRNKNNEYKDGFKQVCLYSFPKNLLNEFGTIKNKTFYESKEDIEILRFIELGIKVKLCYITSRGPSVDRPEHIKLVEKVLYNEK